MKITANTIKQAQPKANEYTIWDSELTGFGLRVHPSGRTNFVVKYRVGRGRNARQRKTSLGAPGNPFTAYEARSEAAKMLSEARLGNDPSKALRRSKIETMTVNSFLDMWATEAAPFDRRTGRRRKSSSVEADIRRLNIHVRPLIGDTILAELEADALRKMRRDIADGKTARRVKTKSRGISNAKGGDGTAVATLRILKSALGYAVEKQLIPTNPVGQIKIPPTNQKDRFLSREELSRLGRALDEFERNNGNPNAVNIIRLLALTGARRGEIESLKWENIDFERGSLLLSDTKTGRAAWPLSKPALDLLADLKTNQSSKWVFPASNGDSHYQGINRVWPQIRESAKLEGVRLHDLRHSFASVGAASGLGLQVVGKLLGHKQSSTTARYSHLSDDPLRSAADQIAGHISKMLSDDGADDELETSN